MVTIEGINNIQIIIIFLEKLEYDKEVADMWIYG